MNQSEDHIDQTEDQIDTHPIMTIIDKIMADPMSEFYSIPYDSPSDPLKPDSDPIQPIEPIKPIKPEESPTVESGATPDQKEGKIETVEKSTGGSVIKKYAFLKDEIEEISVESSSKNKKDDSTNTTNDKMMEDVSMESLPVIKHTERGFLSVFTDHPNRFKQTYFEHLIDTLKYSGITIYCSIILVIHAFFPFLFEFSATYWIIHLAQLMSTKLKL